jgi:hypothetical protein
MDVLYMDKVIEYAEAEPGVPIEKRDIRQSKLG